ncbi:MAG TPA: ATP-binding protein [Methylibium sp.]|nr:ATP-binding protein [Methylibium sp.]
MRPAPSSPFGRLRAWLAARLSNRLALMIGVLTGLVLTVGLLISLALSLRSARAHVDTEIALRADNAAREVASLLDEIERGVHGVASSSFVVRTLVTPERPDDALLPFLLEHRVVRRYGVQLRLCDRTAQRLVRVVPGRPGEPGRLDGGGAPCRDIVDFQGRLHDHRTALLITDDALGRRALQLQIPVRGGQGTLGAVVADIDPALAMRALLANGEVPVALSSAAGELAGRHVDRGYVVIDTPLELPSGSAFAPLGLSVRVGIEERFARVRWGALVAADLGIAVLLGGLAFFAARRLSEQLLAPLGALEQAAGRAAAGEPVELGPALSRDDEVGRLAARVKAMGDSLQRGNATLARQVDELVAARNAAQQASIAKTQFLATMSHEIRTPMHAVLGLSYLALQSPLEGKAREYVEKTHSAAENLLGIINGILDFSKVEAGRLTLERETFALRQVIERVVSTAGVRAHAKGLEIVVRVDERVPQEVVGDALRLGQVLLNLCDNAIKFTDRGHIGMSVRVVRMDEQDVELLFGVSDTGSGIPGDKQQAIFELFTQADASTTRQHGGTGLGLAIARKLVELMGGRIEVRSEVGAGSTFSFTARLGAAAPRAEDPSTAAVAAVEPPPEVKYAALRGATVLLVEDNELNQLLACELLARVGVETLVASDGREAIELLRRHADAVDVVLMDCQMPVMDGFAATRAIRADKTLPRVPILAMTANVLPEDLAHCRGAGMSDHIGKPIDVDRLYALVQEWLHRSVESTSRPTPLDARG